MPGLAGNTVPKRVPKEMEKECGGEVGGDWVCVVRKKRRVKTL